MSIKIQDLKKINTVNVSVYRNQKNVRRCKDVNGGFDKIVYATDQD